MNSRKTQSAHASKADTSAAVDAFMLTLEHPFKREIEAIRRCILGVDPSIAEGIKWNAPSFRIGEYFATMNLRAKGGIGVILHLGAKVKDVSRGGLGIADPTTLLHWLAADRATVVFSGLDDFIAKQDDFARIIAAWIRHVDGATP